MNKAADRPILIKRVNFWWYPLTLIPLLVLAWFSFTGGLPRVLGLLSIFLFFFWLSSLGFALYAVNRKKPDLRQ